MSRSRTIIIDGKRYRWRDILRMRQEQRAATAKVSQLALFADLPNDSRPTQERTASRRYQQPSLF
jgi:hypothetical protein